MEWLKKGVTREIHMIVGVYALFGCAWIFLSDTLLSWLVRDPASRSELGLLKGILFILFTSSLLYQLIGRFARRNGETIRQLSESEARFQTIYHSVNDALLIHEAETGRIVDVNRTMCAMFGYSRDQVLELTVDDLSLGEPPYAQSEARERLDLASAGVPQIFQWRSRKRDGTLFWSEVNMRRATINGERRIIVMLRDIDARKEAEEALRKNEEVLKLLMEQMPAGVGWADERGEIQYLNDCLKGCLLDWLGCVPAEVPDLDALMLRALPDREYREMIRALWNGALDESRAQGTPVQPIEARVLCRDGSVRHLFLNSGLVYDRIVFIFTDITKWESMQSELLKAQRLESLGILAGGIAHDFNNILTGILGNLSLASLTLDPSHQARAPLGQAEKASLRAAELARQLLTFAKGGEPVRKAVSVANLVQESLSLALPGSKTQATVELPPSLHAIEADEGQMNQAFNNVIINAVQAMPGGGTLSIRGENVTLGAGECAGLARGSYVKLSFADQGIGISEENRQRIFDPYFTTKAGGSGLGLASAHSIVRKHEGRIAVDSCIGKGTTFTFYLPSTGALPPAPEAQDGTLTSPPPAGQGTILVMDDEETIRVLTTTLLEYLGYAVRSCATGQEAVRLYREAGDSGAPFLAAIMDLTVPGGMGGVEAAGRILAYDPTARLIVSSGYSNDPVMAQHADYGFRAAVLKPYRAEELQQIIEAVAGAGRPEGPPPAPTA